MAVDFLIFNEGAQYLDTNGGGLPATCWFLLSTNGVKDFTAASTLGGGVAEMTGTGYARQSQAAPTPAGSTITFAQMTWNTGVNTNWSNAVKSIVLVTTSDNTGKAICAWDLIASIAAPSSLIPSATATTGGTGAAGTYYWKVTALNANGETTGSAEYVAYLALNATITLTWNTVAGATSYKLYRATTAGGETGATSKVAGTITSPFTDTIAATGAGSCPTSNTTVGSVNLASASQTLQASPILTTSS